MTDFLTQLLIAPLGYTMVVLIRITVALTCLVILWGARVRLPNLAKAGLWVMFLVQAGGAYVAYVLESPVRLNSGLNTLAILLIIMGLAEMAGRLARLKGTAVDPLGGVEAVARKIEAVDVRKAIQRVHQAEEVAADAEVRAIRHEVRAISAEAAVRDAETVALEILDKLEGEREDRDDTKRDL